MTQAQSAAQQVNAKNKKIEEIRPDEDDNAHSCRTFVIDAEDHTLGNSLRYIVMQDERVTFCGYTIPHPSQHKINFRIQTDGSCSAEDALRTGLDNLSQAGQTMMEKFEHALDKWDTQKTEPMNQ